MRWSSSIEDFGIHAATGVRSQESGDRRRALRERGARRLWPQGGLTAGDAEDRRGRTGGALRGKGARRLWPQELGFGS